MADASALSVTVDTSSALELLKQTSLSIPRIEDKVLRLVGKLVSKEINSRIKGSVRTSTKAVLGHRYTYNMRKMYTYGKTKKHSLSVYPNRVEKGRSNDLIIPVALTLSYGYDAGKRKGPHMTGRGFIQAGESYAKSGRYMPEVRKLIDRELEKYNSKFM